VIDSASGDPAVQGRAWKDNEIFDFIKQSYLLSGALRAERRDACRWAGRKDRAESRFLLETIRRCDVAVEFSVLTNPEVLRKTAETRGENLLKGLNNLLTDLEQGKRQACVSR